MIWSSVAIGSKSLIHIQQDEGTNQCVAACVGMIAENAKYWRKNENALFSYGATAMINNNGAFPQNDNRELINVNGIRSNSVAPYLQSYGWQVISLNSTNAANAIAMADRINHMANYDCCILAGGVNQLHAFAAIKLDGTTYILNPAFSTATEPELAAFAYHADVVQIDPQYNTNVQFRQADAGGTETFRSVSECYYIQSQSSIYTKARWLYSKIF